DVAVAGPDSVLLSSPVRAQVTVTAVDNCATTTVPCQWTDHVDSSMLIGQSPLAWRTIVTAGSQSWTIYLRLPGFSAALVQPGDSFDMTVDASIYQAPNQPAVLARSGNLFPFPSSRDGPPGRLPPSLDNYGVVLTDAGPICQRPISCMEIPHAIGATIGTATAVAPVEHRGARASAAAP